MITNVSVSNPGVSITPSAPANSDNSNSNQQRTIFSVVITQLQEIDPNNNLVYAITTQGQTFTLQVKTRGGGGGRGNVKFRLLTEY